MAVGDINGDNLPDVFVGGATGQSGQLLLQTPERAFELVVLPCLNEHRTSEDMGCLLVDVDGDEDLDLYVVSGGVEHGVNAQTIAIDFTSMNRRKIRCTSPMRLMLCRTCETAAVPSLRPTTTTTVISICSLVVVLCLGSIRVNRVAGYCGMIVDVSLTFRIRLWQPWVWSPALCGRILTNDGWVDLLITNDYGPIRAFRNEQGSLIDVSNEFGTSELLGWWNSITGCDLDLDGDIDYVVGNFGRNTKYHPSRQKPQYLFYGNFQGGDVNHIVEAKSGDAGLLPTRGRSCSSNAMPFISDKFDTYHSFALASLNEIYSDTLLAKAHRVAATHVESGVLMNIAAPDGTRTLEFRPLPLIAQMSPVFGIEVLRVNQDSWPDLFLAQNFYTPQRETGRMSGGVGCVLLGNGGRYV